MELDQALKATGFEKCQFGPDSDPCESCHTPKKQLYFRSGGYEHPNDGEYFCGACVKKEADENALYKVKTA